MALSDHKAVIALALIHSKPAQAPRWHFNTTLLCDKAFETMFSSQLMDFAEINKGSVDDPRILWDAVIRNFALCFQHKEGSRLHDLESKLCIRWFITTSFDEDVIL